MAFKRGLQVSVIFNVADPPTVFSKILNLCILPGKNMGLPRSQILKNTVCLMRMKIKLCGGCAVGLMSVACPVGAGVRWV